MKTLLTPFAVTQKVGLFIKGMTGASAVKFDANAVHSPMVCVDGRWRKLSDEELLKTADYSRTEGWLL